jgi:hypothetical protein
MTRRGEGREDRSRAEVEPSRALDQTLRMGLRKRRPPNQLPSVSLPPLRLPMPPHLIRPQPHHRLLAPSERIILHLSQPTRYLRRTSALPTMAFPLRPSRSPLRLSHLRASHAPRHRPKSIRPLSVTSRRQPNLHLLPFPSHPRLSRRHTQLQWPPRPPARSPRSRLLARRTTLLRHLPQQPAPIPLPSQSILPHLRSSNLIREPPSSPPNSRRPSPEISSSPTTRSRR